MFCLEIIPMCLLVKDLLNDRDIDKVLAYELISNYILKPITPNDFETAHKADLVKF